MTKWAVLDRATHVLQYIFNSDCHCSHIFVLNISFLTHERYVFRRHFRNASAIGGQGICRWRLDKLQSGNLQQSRSSTKRIHEHQNFRRVKSSYYKTFWARGYVQFFQHIAERSNPDMCYVTFGGKQLNTYPLIGLMPGARKVRARLTGILHLTGMICAVKPTLASTMILSRVNHSLFNWNLTKVVGTSDKFVYSLNVTLKVSTWLFAPKKEKENGSTWFEHLDLRFIEYCFNKWLDSLIQSQAPTTSRLLIEMSSIWMRYSNDSERTFRSCDHWSMSSGFRVTVFSRRIVHCYQNETVEKESPEHQPY